MADSSPRQSGKEALRTVILSCFSAILSGNQQQMKDAEEELKALQVTKDFGLVLAEITIAQDGPVPYRQLSSVILKQYVKNHWTVHSDEIGELSTLSSTDHKLNETIPNEQTKKGIRQTLLHGLGDPLSKIRATVAYAISAIAQSDWPENWPDLFDELMAGLASGSPELVHGTMRVLTEFCHEVTDSHIPDVAPVILPQLLRVIAEPQVYSIRTRSRAINIFTILSRLIHTVNSLTPNTAQSFLFPYLSSYIEAFIRILSSNDESNTDPGIRKEIILSLSKLLEFFPGVIKPHLMAIVTPIWNILVSNINFSGDVYDSDGEVINFDSVLVAIFQFITAVLIYLHQSQIFVPILGDLVYHLITLIQMTSEQIVRWETDVYKYLEEDESELSYSVRLLAFDLLLQLSDSRPLSAQVYQYICSMIEKHLTESPQGSTGRNGEWWKIHEACFLVVGLAVVENGRKSIGNFNSQVFVEKVLLPDITASAPPILTGRCIWLASKLSSQLEPETTQRCLEATLSGLQPDQHMIIRAMAAKAVFFFCEELKDERYQPILAPYLPYFISLLCDLASTSQDILLFTILDSLQLVCQKDYSVTASHCDRLVPLMIALFLKFSFDPAVSSCIEDMFICLSNNPGCHPLLHSRFLPTAMELLLASESQIPLGMVSSTLEVLVLIIRGCDSPLPQLFIDELYPIVAQRVLLSEDAAILQNGGECVRAFISKASEQLTEWKDSNGRSGLHYATEVVMHLLDPARPEYSAAFVDKLIIVFVKKAGSALGVHLELLLRSVLSKMQQVETPSVMQSLLIVFAHLASTDQLEGLISFLSQVPDPNGRPALEYVVTRWCNNHASFFGDYEQRVSTIALCQLLSHCLNTGDHRLNNIVVTEEDTTAQPDGVMTRSRKATSGTSWIQVPLPVKLTKVLLEELKSQVEDQEDGDNDGDDIGEEEEENNGELIDEEQDDTWSSDVQVGDMINTLEELYQSEEGPNTDGGNDDDPDLKDEALLKIDLYAHLKQYFTELCGHSHFPSLLPHLSLYEKKLLNEVGSVL